ncbi:MAG: ArnT family glycosyltransferase [Fimbriimonas sp.]
MSRNLAFVLLAALIAIHMGLAFGFASLTPYRTGGAVNGAYAKDIGAPDERQHANYIARLQRGEGFPTFDPKDPDLYETYQSHQPPLYYLVASGFASAVGARDLGAAEDGQRMRWLNLVFGGLTVLGVFMLATWVYTKPEIAVTAAAIAALLPMNAALSGAISNDPLLITLCTWSLALLAKFLKSGGTWEPWVAAVLVGLALLTKTTALALVPVLIYACAMAKSKQRMTTLAGCLVLALAIPSWWWVRNTQLYGDPFALKAFNDAFQGSAQKAFFISEIIPRTSPGQNPELVYWTQWVLWWTARSFVGVFGYMDIWLTDSGSPTGYSGLYMVILGVLGVGAVAFLPAAFDNEHKKTGDATLIQVAFTLLIVLLFVRFNTTYFQAQARYLLPALGPIAVGIALGWAHLLKKRPLVPLALFVVLLLGANAFAFAKLPSEFAKRIDIGRRLQTGQ